MIQNPFERKSKRELRFPFCIATLIRVFLFNSAASGMIGSEAKWLTVVSGVRLPSVSSGFNLPASPLYLWGDRKYNI